MGRIVGVLLICILVTACGGKKGGDIAKSEKDNEKASVNKPPVIESFKAVPQEGEAPLKVTFSWKVKDPDGDKITCSLDVNGDGAYEYKFDNCKENGSQEHTYKEPGKYNAVIKVVDNKGNSSIKDIKNLNVIKPNSPPKIEAFKATPEEGMKPIKVSFTWYVKDADGDVLTCKLDANGDGTADIVVEECNGLVSKSFTYNEIGEYFPKLTVEDKRGGTSEETIRVYVYPGWVKVYRAPGNDIVNKIIATSDGGYIFVGSTNSFGAGNMDILVVKLDREGNIQWQKTYGGPNYDEGVDIMETYDGGYIILGRTESFSKNFSDIWIIKIDDKGNIMWEKAYDSGANDIAVMFYKVDDYTAGVLAVEENKNENIRNIIVFTFKIENGDLVLGKEIFLFFPISFKMDVYPQCILYDKGDLIVGGVLSYAHLVLIRVHEHNKVFYIHIDKKGSINVYVSLDEVSPYTKCSGIFKHGRNRFFLIYYNENEILIVDEYGNNGFIPLIEINNNTVTLRSLYLDPTSRTIIGTFDYNNNKSGLFISTISGFASLGGSINKNNIKYKNYHSYYNIYVYEINNIGKSVIDYIDNKGFILAVELRNNNKDVMLAVIDERDGIIISDKYKDLFLPIKPSGATFKSPTVSIYWEPFTVFQQDIQLDVSTTNAIQNDATLLPETWAP